MISPIIPGGSTTEEGPIIMAWWSAFGVARLHFLDWLSIIVGVWGCGLIKAAVKAESGRCEAQHRGFNPRRRASSRRDLRNLISPAQKEMTFFHNGGSSTSVHRSLFFKSMLAIKRSSASFSMVSVVSVMDFFFLFLERRDEIVISSIRVQDVRYTNANNIITKIYFLRYSIIRGKS